MGVRFHPRNPGWERGNHWVNCQRCGIDVRHNEAHKEWTGLIVCSRCWESRHPQELIRVRPDDIMAKGLVTSEGTDDFIIICDSDARAGIALSGCAICGWDPFQHELADNIVPSGTFNPNTL